MSTVENTEGTETLAGSIAEALDSETLMADSGSRLEPELQNDREVGINGNGDSGTVSRAVVESQDKLYGDGISQLAEVQDSLENVDGKKGINGGENVDEETENLMVDGRTEEDNSRGDLGEEQEQGREHLFMRMTEEEDVSGKTVNEIVDGGTKENSSKDKVGVEHVFSRGDFVWGKIRSHPWWPGRIYDVLDASAFALKYRTTGRLLVAYFGDGSFTWCPVSQLVPFLENFEEKSKQSTSRSFLNAVNCALDEMSVLVELDMTCKCISEETHTALRPLAVNAGIKQGVLVPEGKCIKALVSKYETAEILKALKYPWQTISDSPLHTAVIKGWLSAFYRAKSGRPLARYCLPILVEGLEDKKDDGVINANDFTTPIEVPIQGSSEAFTPGTGDKVYQRRKQKSVSELMVETSAKKRKSAEAKGHTSKNYGDTESAKTKQLSVSIPESDEHCEQLDMNFGPLSRERKRSKYLSPPYTSPGVLKASFKKELEMESQKISDMTTIGERMTKAARLILSNNGNEAVKVAERFDGANMSSHGSITFDAMDVVNTSVNELVSKIRSTAQTPRLLRNESLDKIRGFISMFRDSVYLEGTNFKKYHKAKTGKKRKSQSDTKSPYLVPSHAKKRKADHVEAGYGRETSSLVLTVTFAAGFSLPSEDEIVRIYEQFGDLNEKETKVLHDSNSFQIVYTHDMYTEEAFKESVKQSPFGASKVNFKLSSSDTLRTSLGENLDCSVSLLQACKGKSPVQQMKQKLKEMGSILETCDGKMTAEEKSELEGEIRGMLEKVSMLASTNS